LSTIDPTPQSERYKLTWSLSQTVHCSETEASPYLQHRDVRSSGLSRGFFVDLLQIYSYEEYMGIIVIPNSNGMPSFNFKHFVVSEKLHGEQ